MLLRVASAFCFGLAVLSAFDWLLSRDLWHAIGFVALGLLAFVLSGFSAADFHYRQ